MTEQELKVIIEENLRGWGYVMCAITQTSQVCIIFDRPQYHQTIIRQRIQNTMRVIEDVKPGGVSIHYGVKF
jgi:hypothetical protein